MGPRKDQEGIKIELSSEQEKLLRLFKGEHSTSELKEQVGRSNRVKFKETLLKPLIEAELVEMTEPNKPTSKNQRYRLTKAGKNFLLASDAAES